MLMSFIVPLLIFLVTTYIHIKIKFAQNEPQAMSHIKNLIYGMSLIFLCVLAAYNLIKHFTSESPLDRYSLAVILFNSFALFYFFLGLQVYLLARAIQRAIEEALKRIKR